MAKRTDPVAKRRDKQQAWIARTMQWSGFDEATVAELLHTPRTQSLRVNPLRGGIAPKDEAAINWCVNGYTLTRDQANYAEAVAAF